MAAARSKVTSQGRVSVPVEVRRMLGVGPGSVLEWDEEDGYVIVRRSGRFSSEELHDALFARRKSMPHSIEELKSSVRRHLKAKNRNRAAPGAKPRTAKRSQPAKRPRTKR